MALGIPMPLDHPFRKGRYPGAGKQKGTPNKFTSVRNSFIAVFQRLGSDAWLEEQARKDPKLFLMLMSKLLPREISGSVEITIDFRNRLELARSKALETQK